MKPLSARLIETCVAIAKTGSMKRAALYLGVHERTVWSRVNLIEKKMGMQLFIRQRGVPPKLTDAGKVLVYGDYR